MKFLYVGFLLLFSISIGFAQQSSKSKQADWSALFPKIPNCERVVQPMKQTGAAIEQTAVYERANYKINKYENYFGCGSITLRVAPSARKWARENYSVFANFPTTQKLQIKTFDAYGNSPLCGNDEWIGSTEIYFDKDKVLFLSAYVGASAILEFAETADYKLMRKSINRSSKSKPKEK